MAEEPRPKSWWSTLPGVLTAIAGIITAVTGLIVTLHQAGFFNGKKSSLRKLNITQSSRSRRPGPHQ